MPVAPEVISPKAERNRYGMRKNTEQQKQSAMSTQETAMEGNSNDFAMVASNSSLTKKHPQQPLVGRSVEADLLIHAYERSCTVAGVETSPDLPTFAATSSFLKEQHSQQQQQQKPQEMVLIRGASGTGKTTMVMSTLRSRVHGDQGFFLTGKFELSGRQDPYAIFVTALAQFVNIMLGSDGEISNNNNNGDSTSQFLPDERLPIIRRAIQQAVGAEGCLLTDMIPSLEKIIGKQDQASNVTGSEARHRFHFVFSKFCRAISSIAPLVLFIDDLQWSDLASLELLQALLQPPSMESLTDRPSALLVVASFRDDELAVANEEGALVTSSSNKTPFQRHLKEFWQQPQTPSSTSTLRVTEISLGNLSEVSVNNLVANTLELLPEATVKLAGVIHIITGGNIFHTLQYLRLLSDRGVLYQDPVTHKTTWNDAEIEQIPFANRETIETLMGQKFKLLPPRTQELLQVAACIGDEFDLTILSLLQDCEMIEILKELEPAVDKGLLIVSSEQGHYRFLHDRIRQVVFSHIDDGDALSLNIGRKLWKQYSVFMLSASVHTVASLLNKGIELVTDQRQRYEIAALNLDAGMKAANLAAFPDASRYLGVGIQLLQGGNYWEDEYDLTLNLYNAAADTALCNREFDKVTKLTSEVIQHARSCLNKFPSYVTQINALGQYGSLDEAVRLGLNVLQQLGEPLPHNPSTCHIKREMSKTKILIRRRSNNELLRLKPMLEEEKLAAVHILSVLRPYATQSGSPHVVFIGTRLVQMYLKHGMSKACAVGFLFYSTFVCRTDRKSAYRFGQLALAIIDKLHAREMIPRIHAFYYFLIHHWMHPVRDSLRPLQQASQIGLEIGDIEYANYSALFRGKMAFYSGMALDQVKQIFTEVMSLMEQHKMLNLLVVAHIFFKVVTILTASDYEQKELAANFHPFAAEVPPKDLVAWIHHSCCSMVAYLFGELDLAEDLVNRRIKLKSDLFAEFFCAQDQFYHALIAIGQARRGVCRRRNKGIAHQLLRTLSVWAQENPHNWLNKCRLIEAELKSLNHEFVTGSNTTALYQEAIGLALEQGLLQDAAIACELAGDYMYRRGENTLAMIHWEKANLLYIDWGAFSKAAQLRLQKQQLAPGRVVFPIEAPLSS